MKVMIFSPSYPPVRCGVGDYTHELANEIVARTSFDVTVMTSQLPEIARQRGRLTVAPLIDDWRPNRFFRHYLRFRRERARLLIVEYPAVLPGPHSALIFMLPLLARVFLPSARVVFLGHEFAIADARRWLWLATRFAHAVAVVNERDRSAVADLGAWAAHKVRVITIGSSIPPVSASAVELARVKWDTTGQGNPVVLFFGFLRAPEKGFEDLLQALSLLGDRRVLLAVTGHLEERQPYHDTLRERVAELKLGDRVRWLGYLGREEIAKWLRAADAVALPFAAGATPNRSTLLAALANGAAVVTTAGEATPEYLVDGQNALLVRPEHPEELAAALERVLHDADLRERLRQGAAALAPRFSWSHAVDELLAGAHR